MYNSPYIQKETMRIVLVHPNYYSFGAELVGSWPPAWVVYLTGQLEMQVSRTFISLMQ